MRTVRRRIPKKRGSIRRVVVLRRFRGNVAVITGRGGASRIPPSLEDVPSIETEGMSIETIAKAVPVVRRMPCVVQYMGREAAAEQRALYRFLLVVLYSLSASHYFATRTMY